MQKISQLSITNRLYLLVSLTVTTLFVLNFVFNEYRILYLEKQQAENNIQIISSILASRVNQSFSGMLESKEALAKTRKEQVLILNSVLQPIVDDVFKIFPEYGMGYYSIELDSNLAIQPNYSPSKLISLPHSRPFFKIYQTGKPMLSVIEKTVAWGEPGLNYATPIYYNGKIIGHSWGNVNLTAMYRKFYLNVFRDLLICITILLLSLCYVKRVFTKAKTEVMEISYSIVNKDKHVKINLLPELKPVLTMVKDYTAQIEANREKTEEILERITDGFFALDKEWRFTYINKEAAKLWDLDREEYIGKYFHEHRAKIFFDRYVEAVQKMASVHFEDRSPISGIWFEVNAYPSKEGISVFFRDITARREISRLSELNLVGQMAAGVGHEVRNPMTTVRGFLQMLKGKDDCKKYISYYDLMIDELDRANSIITEFLSLARRKQSDGYEIKDLNQIINSLSPLLEAQALNDGKNILLSLNNLPDINVNEKEIRQLILNLVKNGFEVSPRVELGTFVEDKEVVMFVKDYGSGIQQELVSRIGTPFFTTKAEGTGLGLATCFSIAERHGAKINFTTSANGTTFYIRFKPLAD